MCGIGIGIGICIRIRVVFTWTERMRWDREISERHIRYGRSKEKRDHRNQGRNSRSCQIPIPSNATKYLLTIPWRVEPVFGLGPLLPFLPSDIFPIQNITSPLPLHPRGLSFPTLPFYSLLYFYFATAICSLN